MPYPDFMIDNKFTDEKTIKYCEQVLPQKDAAGTVLLQSYTMH